MKSNPKFGKACYYFLCSFTGSITEETCKRLLNDIIASAGMRPSHPQHTWNYEGDIGWITAAPLIESMCWIDVWPNHQGGYLHLDSCKVFDKQAVIDVMRCYDLEMFDTNECALLMP